MKHVIVIACLALAGCQLSAKPPINVTVTGCGQYDRFTPEEQSAIADWLEGAPPPVQRMSQDWASLRDQARACQRRR